MRLRRGFLYAAIHFGVAVALVFWQEAPFWEYIPDVPAAPRRAPHEVAAQGVDEGPSEDRAPMNPCEAAAVSERPISSQEKILAVDNLPVALITGWHLPCSEPSRMDKLIQARLSFTRKSERVTGWLIVAMALLLWFVVGGYPLMRKRFRRWYTEPSLFMTLCTLASMLLLGIAWFISRIQNDLAPPIAEVINQVAALPMVFALAGWVWWLGLFFYTRAKAMRRRLERRARAAE